MEEKDLSTAVTRKGVTLLNFECKNCRVKIYTKNSYSQMLIRKAISKIFPLVAQNATEALKECYTFANYCKLNNLSFQRNVNVQTFKVKENTQFYILSTCQLSYYRI